MKQPKRENYRYHSRYCEENIWHLCQRPEFINSDVLVIASRRQHFPILCQRESEAADIPLLWDYHVVLLWHAAEQFILDFDTTLPFCTPLERYFEQSFIDEARIRPDFLPLFRVMPAQHYADSLLSDRRHMRDGDSWMAEPPDWPAISETESNLYQFTDMADTEFGEILTAAELLQRYT